MLRSCALCAVSAEHQAVLTCIRGWDALGEDAVCDDVKHTERKHHGDDDEAEMEHILHESLQGHISKQKHLS